MIINKELITGLIQDINQDTTRAGLIDLSSVLIQYSFELGEQKGKLVDVKKKMRQKEKELKKEIRLLEPKITVDNLNMKIDDNLKYRDMVCERASIDKGIDETTDVIKSIYEHINVIKFLDRDTIKAEKVFNSQPQI